MRKEESLKEIVKRKKKKLDKDKGVGISFKDRRRGRI